MRLIKDGIAKTIPDNKIEEYKSAGWVEVKAVVAEPEPKQAEPEQEQPEQADPEQVEPEQEEKPKRGRGKKEA